MIGECDHCGDEGTYVSPCDCCGEQVCEGCSRSGLCGDCGGKDDIDEEHEDLLD